MLVKLSESHFVSSFCARNCFKRHMILTAFEAPATVPCLPARPVLLVPHTRWVCMHSGGMTAPAKSSLVSNTARNSAFCDTSLAAPTNTHSSFKQQTAVSGLGNNSMAITTCVCRVRRQVPPGLIPGHRTNRQRRSGRDDRVHCRGVCLSEACGGGCSYAERYLGYIHL